MMIFTSMGDLAQKMLSNRLNAGLQTDLVKLTAELTTGETSTPSRHLSSDFRYLSAVEHRKRTAQAYETAASEALSVASAMQTALGRIQTSTQDLSNDLVTAVAGPEEGRQAVALTAEQTFAELVSVLNTSFAGRSLFAGNATNSAALISADDLLNAIRTTVADETTAQGVTDAVATYFSQPDGFQENAYLGSSEPFPPFKLGENESIQLNMRADAQELRELLASTAIAAISGDFEAVGLRQELQETAGLALLREQGNLTTMRADLGFAEARIEEIGVEIAAERTALDFARESLLGIDEYETATLLENTQFQIEALYTVTSRLSGLSLLGYLR
jgi:flagellar hook-associated protein 3 FlgL